MWGQWCGPSPVFVMPSYHLLICPRPMNHVSRLELRSLQNLSLSAFVLLIPSPLNTRRSSSKLAHIHQKSTLLEILRSCIFALVHKVHGLSLVCASPSCLATFGLTKLVLRSCVCLLQLLFNLNIGLLEALVLYLFLQLDHYAAPLVLLELDRYTALPLVLDALTFLLP